MSPARVLGFDIRFRPEDYMTIRWTPGRREAYLLNPETEWPLSVDSLVWPSVFAFPTRVAGVAPPHTLRRIPAEAEHTDDDLWIDLHEMRQRFTEFRTKDSKGGIEICVQLLESEDLSSDKFGASILEKVPDPPMLPSESSFLGYDVADAGLISGLSNCSYSVEDRPALRNKWARKLNAYGLFSIAADAFEFREVTNQRVRQHVPFWIFGLYRLGE